MKLIIAFALYLISQTVLCVYLISRGDTENSAGLMGCNLFICVIWGIFIAVRDAD